MNPPSSTPESSTKLLLSVRRRAPALVFLFGLWGLLVIARLFQVMVIDRDRYLLDMTRASWHRGIIPAIRGRLLDIDGHPLAWSTRHFQLLWHVPFEPADIHDDWARITAVYAPAQPPLDLPTVRRQSGQTILLDARLQPSVFAAAATAAAKSARLEVSSYFIRETTDQRLRPFLGQIRSRHGMEIGVSGQERHHDSLLRGRPGLYQVMVGPDGKWLPETWEKVRDVQPGYDVYLSIRTPTRN